MQAYRPYSATFLTFSSVVALLICQHCNSKDEGDSYICGLAADRQLLIRDQMVQLAWFNALVGIVCGLSGTVDVVMCDAITVFTGSVDGAGHLLPG